MAFIRGATLRPGVWASAAPVNKSAATQNVVIKDRVSRNSAENAGSRIQARRGDASACSVIADVLILVSPYARNGVPSTGESDRATIGQPDHCGEPRGGDRSPIHSPGVLRNFPDPVMSAGLPLWAEYGRTRQAIAPV